MKISIITACFNSAATIAYTLRSVREQTHKNIEHIVIDGCSKDKTLELVAAEGPHVARVISERDNGIYDAMNKGIQLATGDAVAFLNADDFYKYPYVLAQVAEAMAAEQLDAIYGDVDFFRQSRRDSVVRRYNSGRFNTDRLGWGWMPAHPALFVRRAIFDRFGLFRPDYRIAGDFEFIARVFKHTELRHRHWPGVIVSMQMGGVSTSGWRSTLQLNREMIRACKANDIPTSWPKMLLRYPFKALEYFSTST